MAATWAVEIKVLDTPNRIVSVTGTRTAGTDVRVYTLPKVSVDTKEATLAAIRLKVVNELYALYAEQIAAQTAAAAVTSGWESAVAADLNAKEGA
ncbi:MAG: hypothetical protein IMZ57_04090 [Acidobacteria bacterium]|nr:hypothetical protein [Acidobacteriota bacterium]